MLEIASEFYLFLVGSRNFNMQSNQSAHTFTRADGQGGMSSYIIIPHVVGFTVQHSMALYIIYHPTLFYIIAVSG